MTDMVLVELTNRLFIVQALLAGTFKQQDPRNVHPHQDLVLAAPFPSRKLHLLLTIDLHLHKYRNHLSFRLQSCSSWGCG